MESRNRDRSPSRRILGRIAIAGVAALILFAGIASAVGEPACFDFDQGTCPLPGGSVGQH